MAVLSNTKKEKKRQLNPKFQRKLYNMLYKDDENDPNKTVYLDSSDGEASSSSEINKSKKTDRGVLRNTSNTSVQYNNNSTDVHSARSKSDSSANDPKNAGMQRDRSIVRESTESNESLVLTTSRAVDTAKLHHHTSGRKENTNTKANTNNNTLMTFDQMALSKQSNNL
jgi:hypothetical protein